MRFRELRKLLEELSAGGVSAPGGGGAGAELLAGKIVGVFDAFDPAWIIDPNDPNLGGRVATALADVPFDSLESGALAYTRTEHSWWEFNPYDVSSGGWPPAWTEDPGPAAFHGWRPLAPSTIPLTVGVQRTPSPGQIDIFRGYVGELPFGQIRTPQFYVEKELLANDAVFWNIDSGWPAYEIMMSPYAVPMWVRHSNGKALQFDFVPTSVRPDRSTTGGLIPYVPIAARGTQAEKDAAADTFEVVPIAVGGNLTPNCLRVKIAGRIIISGSFRLESVDPFGLQ